MARFAVVGGGMAGLAAAWEFHRAGAEVVVFESSGFVGGKVSRSAVPGLDFALDDGADAFLARVPDALELCAELGIDDLVHPSSRDARIFGAGALRPLPAEHVLGVPTSIDAVAATGLVSDAGVATLAERSAIDHPAPGDDVSIGDLLDERLGPEVTTRVVEPLIGGINAGEAHALSTQAVAPQIWAAASRGGSLLDAAAALRAGVDVGAPVFATPRAGVSHLPEVLAQRLGESVRLGHRVQRIEVLGGTAGAGASVDGDRFDGVVVATPATVAGVLLDSVAPEAAEGLAGIEYSSVAMVTLTAPLAAFGDRLNGSGFVVARDAGLDITACSWGSSKWAHWNDGEHAVLRVSIGHHGDPVDHLARSDDDLVDTAIGDVCTAMDLDAGVFAGLGDDVGARVGRWPAALPQYRPGHRALVAEITDAVAGAGAIRIAGAALDGLGIPACIRQGRAAARSLLG